jgi:hypothetical protein
MKLRRSNKRKTIRRRNKTYRGGNLPKQIIKENSEYLNKILELTTKNRGDFYKFINSESDDIDDIFNFLKEDLVKVDLVKVDELFVTLKKNLDNNDFVNADVVYKSIKATYTNNVIELLRSYIYNDNFSFFLQTRRINSKANGEKYIF